MCARNRAFSKLSFKDSSDHSILIRVMGTEKMASPLRSLELDFCVRNSSQYIGFFRPVFEMRRSLASPASPTGISTDFQRNKIADDSKLRSRRGESNE